MVYLPAYDSVEPQASEHVGEAFRGPVVWEGDAAVRNTEERQGVGGGKRDTRDENEGVGERSPPK